MLDEHRMEIAVRLKSLTHIVVRAISRWWEPANYGLDDAKAIATEAQLYQEWRDHGRLEFPFPDATVQDISSLAHMLGRDWVVEFDGETNVVKIHHYVFSPPLMVFLLGVASPA